MRLRTRIGELARRLTFGAVAAGWDAAGESCLFSLEFNR